MLSSSRTEVAVMDLLFTVGKMVNRFKWSPQIQDAGILDCQLSFSAPLFNHYLYLKLVKLLLIPGGQQIFAWGRRGETWISLPGKGRKNSLFFAA